jgi:ribosomal protein L7/L12
MKPYRVAFALSVAAALVGCSSITVHRVDLDTDASGKLIEKQTKIDGVPFYIKVPQWSQTTTYARDELHVSVTVFVRDGEEVKASRVWPAAGPRRLKNDAATREKVSNALQQLAPPVDSSDKTPSDIAFSNYYDTVVKHLVGLFPSSDVDDQPSDADTYLVSNVWSLSMVTGPTQYRIAARQPLFGSSNSEFGFDSDGTMTKVVQNTTDDTAKVLLGLFPITEKLKQRWGIAEAPPAAASGAEASARTRSAESKQRITIETNVTEVKTAVVLKKVEDIKPSGQRKPLKIADAKSNNYDVQLEVQTSAVVGSDASPTKPASADGAYVIEGRIVPPKPTDAGGAGGAGSSAPKDKK